MNFMGGPLSKMFGPKASALGGIMALRQGAPKKNIFANMLVGASPFRHRDVAKGIGKMITNDDYGFGQAAFEEFSAGVIQASDQEATMLAGAGPPTGIPTGAPGETIDSMTEIIQSVPQAPMMAARGGKVPEAPGDFSYEAWGSVPPMPMRAATAAISRPSGLIYPIIP